ncbi:hypothetical protein LEMA_P016950.1 [Plenodomus lingam JN3]|uniref:Major facilitator superfamily (MFS) profile domain-containing protein n=1 Tax=Leptosphaeria maculans (strain JN3 / isolate v23.1.3 / race Av1-4-5-6-7-8) TaxID=985895 RepID=E5AA74_LEPMJ|nr:hypothetical protein LEMA_P016950.1 [Plenodomus lingam JN3]CBY00565.1 hypothetical protein LEMA_P016950.1 [Plenodomus lingam JN3]
MDGFTAAFLSYLVRPHIPLDFQTPETTYLDADSMPPHRVGFAMDPVLRSLSLSFLGPPHPRGRRRRGRKKYTQHVSTTAQYLVSQSGPGAQLGNPRYWGPCFPGNMASRAVSCAWEHAWITARLMSRTGSLCLEKFVGRGVAGEACTRRGAWFPKLVCVNESWELRTSDEKSADVLPRRRGGSLWAKGREGEGCGFTMATWRAFVKYGQNSNQFPSDPQRQIRNVGYMPYTVKSLGTGTWPAITLQVGKHGRYDCRRRKTSSPCNLRTSNPGPSRSAASSLTASLPYAASRMDCGEATEALWSNLADDRLSLTVVRRACLAPNAPLEVVSGFAKSIQGHGPRLPYKRRLLTPDCWLEIPWVLSLFLTRSLLWETKFLFDVMANFNDTKDGALDNKAQVEERHHGVGLAANMSPERRAEVEKKLKFKLDLRCSLFILIYIMNYLDRNNIASARLGGLQEDLGINNTQYATCLSILYVGYILMQVPSNIIINRIARPSLYIAVIMLAWGMISTLSGIVTNFSGMVAIRFFIGFTEAAFLPGALLILSKWYTKRELTLRNALLFCGNLISNAFSSLVGAAVLGNMEGVLGHRAWRWLYWIEGAATMAIAISAAFILPDLPHNSRGFTEEERAVAVLRMTEDVGEVDADSEEQGVFDGLFMAVKDTKIYVMMLTFTAYVVGLSFNAFFPTLTQTLGFSRIGTLLMSAPPWAFACIVSIINAWHADRQQERFWHIVGPIFGGLVGFVISMSTSNTAGRYVALFLQASSYAGFIVFYSWISSSFPRPPAKRAVAIAMVNAFSQLGNIAGSYVWNMKDNGYRNSYGVVTAMFGVTIVGCYIFKLILVRLNKRLDEGTDAWVVHGDVAEQTARTEGISVEDGQKLMKDFRYLV